METTRVDVTADWQQVVVMGTEFTIQNIGDGIVEVGYQGANPLPDDPIGYTGIVLTKYKGISSAIFGLGDVFIKGSVGGQVIVSK
jgi:hypothetical protein